MRLSVKLPLAIVLMGLAATTLMGVFAFREARSALIAEGEDRIRLATAARRQEVSEWFDAALSDIAFQSTSPNVVNALRSFDGAWAALGDDADTYLRDVFIVQNPAEATQRDTLIYPKDRSAYSRNHKKYHEFFQSIAHKNGFEDVYLLDRDGRVLYSVFKLDDFAQVTPPSALGDALDRAIAVPEGSAVLLPFQPYPAGAASSAMFASVVRDGGGSPIGAIAYRVSDERLSTILNRSAVLGAGTVTYLIAPDQTIQVKLGADTPLADPNSLHADRSLERSGAPNAELLVSHETIDVAGQPWQVISQTPLVDLIATANQLRTIMVQQGAIGMFFLALCGLLVARSMVRPLAQVRDSMATIGTGAYDVDVPVRTRRDEIGAIAQTLDEFRLSLLQAEATRRDIAVKNAALEASSAALMIVETDGTIAGMTPSAVRLFQGLQVEFIAACPDLDPNALIGIPLNDLSFIPQTTLDHIQLSEQFPLTAEATLGNEHLGIKINAIGTGNGENHGWVIEWTLITETRRKSALLDTIERHQLQAEFSPLGQLERSNDLFDAAVKQARAGAQWQDLIQSAEGLEWSHLLRGNRWSGQMTFCAPDGTQTVVDGSLTPVSDREGNVLTLALLGNDVTRSAAELQSAEAKRQDMQVAQARVVDTLRKAMAQLRDGNLTVTLNEPFSAEYEQLRQDFNRATRQLGAALREVSDSSVLMRAGSDDIAAASANLSGRAESQARALRETASALDRMTESVQTAAQSADTASQIVAQTRAEAEQNTAALADAEEAMTAILNSSSEIAHIISVIDDIAFQTNLLALNAGVEAARAGEAGRGFAVVASEVRALAQRSAEAASQINGLIAQSGDQVRNGVDRFRQTGAALTKIANSVTEMSDQVDAIARSSKSQSDGLGGINETLSGIDAATQENVAMFEQTTAASQSLLTRSEALLHTLALFETPQAAVHEDLKTKQAG
ncbi:Methyl-accepting chemotaxis protein II [Pseudosulfitobacter sp. DSM 107133]|nr:Methyl-accepting chemotaxis protein II [Pseudosulfitobacter sp. DSM 107133]